VSSVRTGPVMGLFVQIALLAVLAGTVGLGGVGWAVGVGYGVLMCALLCRGLARSGARHLGPADRVTLSRALLVGGAAALVLDATASGRVPVRWVLVGLVAVALSLDWVDGQVARRTGTVSALGARFDMEVDAFLLLVLSGFVADSVGWWVWLIGGMRYGFVIAMWVLPWMRRTLPPRYWRKVVAATQGVVLVVAAAGVLPRWWSVLGLVGALILLLESFGRDVFWLWVRRPVRVAHAPAGQLVAAAKGVRS
jgi:phosphatidylglycerophosphate synthase